MINKEIQSIATDSKDLPNNDRDSVSEDPINEIRSKGYSGDFLLKGTDVKRILSISHNTLKQLKASGEIRPIVFNSNCHRYCAQEISEYINKLKADRNNVLIDFGETQYSREDMEALHTICAEFPDGL